MLKVGDRVRIKYIAEVHDRRGFMPGMEEYSGEWTKVVSVQDNGPDDDSHYDYRVKGNPYFWIEDWLAKGYYKGY